MNKEEAIELLKSYKILIPFDDNLQLYHGRSRTQTELGEWHVDPNYNNTNGNVNEISALNATTEMSRAQDFAFVRSTQNGGTPEVHRITTRDKGALIFDKDLGLAGDLFKVSENKLSESDKQKKQQIQQAFSVLTNFKITEASPLDFEQRKLYTKIADAIKNWPKSGEFESTKVYSKNDIKDICAQLSKSVAISPEQLEAIVTKIAGGNNMATTLKYNPQYAIEKYMFTSDSSPFKHIIGSGEGPTNFEYLASWLAGNNIVGIKQKTPSANINNEVDAYFLFDMTKINTQKANGDKIQQIINAFGPLAEFFEELSENDFVKEIENMSPKEMVELLKTKHISCKQLLEESAGVWEGFSVGEHTETVLRLFDKSYDEMPSQLKSFMKLSILMHDIGKGVAVKKREPEKQKEWSEKYSQDLLEYLGVDQKYIDMVKFVALTSQEYTSLYYVKNINSVMDNLHTKALQTICDTMGEVPSEEAINGLVECCKAMQTCDSGAYTRFAVTRDKDSGFYYHNGNDRFTEGMTMVNGRIRFKKDVMPSQAKEDVLI